MKKSQITESLIESLSGSINDKFSERVDAIVEQVVSCAVNELSQKNAFVSPERCILIPVNETVTGAFTQCSEFDYFFGLDNPQIALNSKTKRRVNWRFLWSEFKANFTIGKRRDKKKKKEKEAKKQTDSTIAKYNITNLRHDMMNSLSNFLTASSVLYEKTDKITIVGSEDFGTNVKINIFITIFDHATREFKLYNESKNKFFSVNFGKRFEQIQEKGQRCGHKNVVDMLKVFNALYSRSTNKVPNQILIESLVLGCPDSLFVDGDTYRTFVNLANYIRINKPRSFASICEPERSVFDEPLVVKSGAQTQYSRLIRILDEYKF